MNLTPSNNINLFGHNDLVLDLIDLYNKNTLPNKIIFSGNSGIGKCTLAYHLTNYIFSINEENNYDTNENIILKNNYSYNLVTKNSHPNFFLISNDEDKINIQISKIREMIHFSNKSSFNGECKIIIIDNIEYLNISSINALLKIIEEPNNKIFFFLIHNSKETILDTLRSRCIKYNLFLNYEERTKIINKLLKNDFYNNLNDDFKNHYNSPGDIVKLYNFFINNEIDDDIEIENFLKLIINKSLYKKDLYLKFNLSIFLELYFKKKINHLNSKDKIYYFYKYFLLKISECNKYNLDLESILIEFKGKILNGNI
jgi:DNA polymerase-3 subunit delta'